MEKLFNLDGDILLWIQENLRTDFTSVIMKGITRLGDNGTLWIVLAVLFLVINKTRKVGAASAIALIITFLTVNVGIKNIVARPRPYDVIEGLTRIVPAEDNFSFPSGHAAHAFAVGVVILIMMPRKIGVPVFVLSVFIAISRLYVGVHYPSDVFVGAVIGTLIAFLSVFIVNKIAEKWIKRNKEIEEQEKLL